jgi:hypothetical protein
MPPRRKNLALLPTTHLTRFVAEVTRFGALYRAQLVHASCAPDSMQRMLGCIGKNS